MGVPAADAGRVAHRGRRGPAAGWLLDPDAGAAARVRELAAAVAAHDTADPLDPGLPIEAARRASGCRSRGWSRPCCGSRSATRPRRAGGRAGAAPRAGRARCRGRGGWPRPVRPRWTQLRADLRRDPFACPGGGPAGRAGARPAPAGVAGQGRGADAGRGRRGAAARGRRAGGGGARRPRPEFTLSAARQALGTSRRVAVPLLELLARHGRTRADPRRRAPAG